MLSVTTFVCGVNVASRGTAVANIVTIKAEFMLEVYTGSGGTISIEGSRIVL